MSSCVYIGDYHFNLLAASLLRADKVTKDFFFNIDEKHLTLKYRLDEIEYLNSLDDLPSLSYERIILTNPNPRESISALKARGLSDFSVIDYKAYPQPELRSALEFVMGTPCFHDEAITNLYWELRAADIHHQWGSNTFDYAALTEVIRYVRPTRILDIGCGSGSLFNLYSQLHIEEVVGQDISQTALDTASARNLPHIQLVNCRIEALAYEPLYFDLIISNRVLATVSEEAIASCIGKLCRLGKYIYINELMLDDEDEEPCPYFVAHDYTLLFREHGYSIDKNGIIEYKPPEDDKTVKQKWFLFRKY